MLNHMGEDTILSAQEERQRTKRAVIAMLFAGLAIFSGLYSTQAILPELVSELDLTFTEAAMTVSAATGALALCVVPASILSEKWGRGRLLIISAFSAMLVGLAVPLADNAWQLIALRGLQGALLAGAPATAMAWLAEELDDRVLPRAMGIYIAGTSIGGLSGRLVPAAILEFGGWRIALLGSALTSLFFAILAVVLLPKQRNFHPKPIRFRHEIEAMVRHWRNPHLAGLYVIAFLAMGTLVSVYNFVSFRFIEDFGLPPALVGMIFLMYLFGTYSSARAGRFVAEFGHGKTLTGSAALFLIGTVLLIGPMWMAIAGLLLFTIGFFAVHSTASGWVGHLAHANRAEASSMYVFCYYFGSSVVGLVAGALFARVSWLGFVGFYAVLITALVILSVVLTKRQEHIEE